MLALIAELLERKWEFTMFYMGETYCMSLILGNIEHVIHTDEQAAELLDEITTYWS
jgi:hypothetical protein